MRKVEYLCGKLIENQQNAAKQKLKNDPHCLYRKKKEFYEIIPEVMTDRSGDLWYYRQIKMRKIKAKEVQIKMKLFADLWGKIQIWDPDPRGPFRCWGFYWVLAAPTTHRREVPTLSSTTLRTNTRKGCRRFFYISNFTHFRFYGWGKPMASFLKGFVSLRLRIPEPPQRWCRAG